MNGAYIPVFMSTDNNYTVPTYIALYSLLHNYRGERKIKAFILTSSDFSEKNVSLIKSLADKFSFAEIRTVDMADSYDEVAINAAHISKAALYRLMIPRIAERLLGPQAEKCVYLDSDLVVEGNIAELYDLDADGFFCAGVQDYYTALEKGSGWTPDDWQALKEKLDVPTLKNYINSGVLLFNLKEIRARETRDKLEQTGYRNDFPFNDQDAINSAFYGKIKMIPLKFNAMTTRLYWDEPEFFALYGRTNIQEARKKPVVIHYITSLKPWSYRTRVKAGKWWKYANMQDRETAREYIRPFLQKHRAPLPAKAEETVRTLLIYSGVYNLIRKAYYRKKAGNQ